MSGPAAARPRISIPAARWPRISIVVPSYNQAEFLGETLDSLIAQAYPELEIIVIDGGSSDGSVAVIEHYAAHLAYWTSEPDKGQTDALIKGFARATGSILGWLCSDDLLKPGTLHLAAAAFATADAPDMIYGDTEYLYPDGSIQPKPRVAFDREIMLRAFNLIPQPSAFWTRAIYDRAGGLDASFHFTMDYDLFLRFGPAARIVHMPLTLSTYRLHAESKTTSQEDKFGAEFFRARSRALGRPLGLSDRVVRWFYLAKTVLKFGLERGEWLFLPGTRRQRVLPPAPQTISRETRPETIPPT